MSSVEAPSCYITGDLGCSMITANAGIGVTLNLTVNVAGRTLKQSVTGFDATLDDCIAVTMKDWRFRIPKDRSGEATEASFRIALQLVPDR